MTDHLSSVVAVTDGTGAFISQQRYLPFGGERTNIGTISQTDYGYTGQRDLNIDLMDYKARFYSPLLSRFIQPDTITPGGPQGLNRYSYVNNNPINFNDPTGHKACGDGEEYECNTGKKNKNYIRVIIVPEDKDSDDPSAPEVEDELEDMADAIRDSSNLEIGRTTLSSVIFGVPGYYLGVQLCPTTGPVAPLACSLAIGALFANIGNRVLDKPLSAYQYIDATKLDEVRHALNDAQANSSGNIVVSMVTHPTPASMVKVDETGYVSIDPNYHETFSYLYIGGQSPIRLTADQANLVDNAFGGGLIP